MTEIPSLSRRADKEGAAVQRRLSFFPLQQLLLPGLAQLRHGQKAVGIVGIVLSSLSWLGLIVLGVVALVNRPLLYSLITREQPLLVLTVILLIFLVSALVYGVLSTRTIVREAKSTRRRWILAAIVIVVTLLQVVAMGSTANTVNAQRALLSSLFPSGSPGADGASPAQIEPVNGRYNILLLGGDAGAGRTGLRPDSISVVSVNASTGATTIIGVPRNLERTPFVAGSPMLKPFPNGYDCGHKCLISYLYTYGNAHPELYAAPKYRGGDPGMLAMRDAVEGFTGLRLPYIVLMDMNGFAELVDAVGGIDITVPKETLAQDKKTTFKKGPQHMNGPQALLYSRTRYDSNDFGRMTKQRAVQQALLAQADPLKLLINFQGLANTGKKYVKTDIPQEVLGTLVEVALKAKQLRPTTLELVPPKVDNGHPDIPAVHQMVKKVTGG